MLAFGRLNDLNLIWYKRRLTPMLLNVVIRAATAYRWAAVPVGKCWYSEQKNGPGEPPTRPNEPGEPPARLWPNQVANKGRSIKV